MMIYAKQVKKQVDTKNLGLSDKFWAEVTGWLIDCTSDSLLLLIMFESKKLDDHDNIKAKLRPQMESIEVA
jgi:hypothetical protein